MGIMQMWEDLIQKAKDGGLDAIDTYVFWNVHEPSAGNVSILLWLKTPMSQNEGLISFCFWAC